MIQKLFLHMTSRCQVFVNDVGFTYLWDSSEELWPVHSFKHRLQRDRYLVNLLCF